jgi:DNA-binding MarR family transcriptional regulator
VQARHDPVIHRILTEIETGRPVSQRALSRELGVALGLTNLLVRRLVRKGYVKMRRVNSRQVAYLLTPAGLLEKGRITRAYFGNTIRLYTDTREQIYERFCALSREWDDDDRALAGPEKRIAFFGAGEVAEIGYIVLQRTDLRLVGVVDDAARGPFFGLPVLPSEQLRPGRIGDEAFGRLVMMSIRKAPALERRLATLGFPKERVFWL